MLTLGKDKPWVSARAHGMWWTRLSPTFKPTDSISAYLFAHFFSFLSLVLEYIPPLDISVSTMIFFLQTEKASTTAVTTTTADCERCRPAIIHPPPEFNTSSQRITTLWFLFPSTSSIYIPSLFSLNVTWIIVNNSLYPSNPSTMSELGSKYGK